MTPMLWVCGICCPACFTAAVWLRDSSLLCTILVLTGILPILVASGMYVYFGLTDPDRLHTEDYRLRSRALEITESKGGQIDISPVGLGELTNPFPQENIIEGKAS